MYTLDKNQIRFFLNLAFLACALALPCKTLGMHPGTDVATLHEAIENQDLASIEPLLTRENVNAFHDSFTALHVAAVTGNPEILDLVLKAGAEIDATTQNGRWTALHFATIHEHEDVIARLLAAGAEVNHTAYTPRKVLVEMAHHLQDAHAHPEDEDPRNEDPSLTPLQLAMFSENQLFTKRLLDAQADVHARGVDYNETPLHMAAYIGDHQRVDLLLEYGAPTEAPDLYGRTALHYAAANEDPDADPADMIDRLLEALPRD